MRPTLLLTLLAACVGQAAEPEFRPLFDGKTLAGWEGDAKVWRAEGGMIVGGELGRTQERNDFLASRESYGDFELEFEVRLRGEGFVNSGVQFWSERVPNDGEMRGYQADIGPGWWGCLYDESRRNQVLAKPAKPLGRVREGEWNRYRIVARGLRLQGWVNDEPAFDYTEGDSALPRQGRLGLQVHGGGKSRVEFRNLRIREFGGAPKAPGPSPLPAKSEALTFASAPGTVVELVAEESDGIGKFVAMGWDPRGRLWVSTALEYPVDANESPAEAAALYAGKGRDKVLIFDHPGAPGPQVPRVFADGLAIPTGMTPYLDGAIVHHGTDIVRLRDTDGDGRADRRETLLSGFGTQDSHLLPHQFTRAPGGWMWMAQGAFNYSKVRTTKGQVTQFDQTRMAKFKPDGSDFRITSNGPCNIWGLVLRETGEALVQEANDYGYPLMPFHEQANYPGCANGQWKSYAPEFPPTARDFRMGGSGLSGLAPADPGRWPEWARDLVWVANPITCKVQSIRVTGSASNPSLTPGPDLLVSSDPWFRPVAISAGPDGCLYVADWYNKIISHNEVARNHPDRDRVRGRIWRIRPAGIAPLPQEDLLAAKPERLVALLGTGPSTLTHLAWQTLVDRGLVELAPVLRERALDARRPARERVPALWALEGLGKIDAELARAGLRDADASLRREALRVLRDNPNLSGIALAAAAPLATDVDFPVRQECIKLLGELAATDPRALDQLARLIQPSLAGPIGEATHRKRPIPVGAAYEREFERYLIRLALESMPDRVAAYLDEDRRADLEPEAEAWAALALGPQRAAPRIARLLGRLGRTPSREELAALSQGGDNPLVAQALRTALTEGESPARVVEALLASRGDIDRTKAAPLLTPSVLALLARDGAPAELGLRLVAGFALKGTGPACERHLGKANLKGIALAALAANGEGTVPALRPHLADPAAVEALAAADPAALLGAWNELPAAAHGKALTALASSRAGASALVDATLTGKVPMDKLDAPLLGRLQAALGETQALGSLLGKLEDRLRPVARLGGKDEAGAPLGLRLEGPLTFETWLWLEPGITNADGLLGQPNVFDINLHEARARVHLFAPLGDVVIAAHPVSESRWTHLAVVRDAEGRWSIYLNGELDARGTQADRRALEPRLAWSAAKGGLQGALAECRIWNRARSAEEIRHDHDRAVAPGTAGLVFHGTGRSGWPKSKAIAIGYAAESPPVLSAEAAAKRDAAFGRWEKLAAEGGGDPARGKAMATLCQTCHMIKGEGVSIGPELSAVGAMSTDALLRNLLTPNAAYEPGYRVFRVETREGRTTEGFLVSDNPDAVRLRLPGGSEVRFERAEIARTEWLRRSIMPEGLVESLPDETARDLLAYLRTLR